MGKAKTELDMVEGLHADLLSRLKPGDCIPRAKWDALVCRGFRVGLMRAKQLTESGEALGLWKRVRSPRPRLEAGWIELQAAPQWPTLEATLGASSTQPLAG